MATILIVDDTPANRRFLVTLLRPEGHRLVEAANGREGLAAVRAERPDLVITDVLMPVMDGYELVKQLRLDPTTSGIPVVFYTAHYGGREARARDRVPKSLGLVQGRVAQRGRRRQRRYGSRCGDRVHQLALLLPQVLAPEGLARQVVAEQSARAEV